MNRNPAVLLYDANGIALAVRNGVAIPANTPGLIVMGSDGANSRYMAVDSSGRLVAVGAGVAGTPAGGVVSVQGVAAGTVLPISDGGGSVTVDGSVATTQANTTATAVLAALNDTVVIALEGKASVGVFKPTGAMNGTFVAELSYDGGTTWVGTLMVNPLSGSVITSQIMAISLPWSLGIVLQGGATHARVRISSYSSGSISFTLTTTTTPGSAIVTAGLPGGASVPTSANQIAGKSGSSIQVPTVYDLDSGAGSEHAFGVSLRKIASGGSVEAGTSSDPLRVDPTGTTPQPSLISTTLELAAGIFATVFPAGFLRVSDEPRQLFYDPFDGAVLDTGNWNAAASAGGGVAAAVATGALTLGTGTTANGYSYLQNTTSFKLPIPGWMGLSHALMFEAAPTANTYRFWGQGTLPVTPTAAAPVTNGIGWELGTDSKLRAVVYAAGVRTVIQDLSTSGNSKQPTDGLPHRYIMYLRTDKVFWYIDSLDVPVATSSFQSPVVQTLPDVFLAVANSVAPVSTGTITCYGVANWDTSKSAAGISDGVYPSRKATVKLASTAALATDTAIVVALSPNNGAKITDGTNVADVMPANTPVTMADPALVVTQSPNKSQTYSLGIPAFTPPATPTDLFTIIGSATKTVRVLSINLLAVQTASGMNEFRLIKRSAANTGGTSTTPTPVPNDSNNNAATAVVRVYSVNAAALGAAVGNMQVVKLPCPVPASAVVSPYDFDLLSLTQGQGVVLRGVAQTLAINFNGVALPAGLSVTATIVWTEE